MKICCYIDVSFYCFFSIYYFIIYKVGLAKLLLFEGIALDILVGKINFVFAPLRQCRKDLDRKSSP